MSRFDINNANDFKALTLGGIAGAAQALSTLGRNPAEWDIQEASYGHDSTIVLFHVITSKSLYQAALPTVQDIGGRRKVKYKFPYVDGQTTDDLGRKGESFDMEILIHGQRYLDGLKALLAQFDDPRPGDLVHPVRGSMKVAVEDVQIIHSFEKRKAASLKVVFIEHNFTIGDIKASKDVSVKGALSALLDAFSAIDQAITNVLGAVQFALSLRQQIAQLLGDYKNQYNTTAQTINTSFNTRGSADIPGLLPVNQGGTGQPGTGANFPLTGTPIDQTTQNVLPALAATDVAKQVNAARATLSNVIQQIQAMGNPAGQLGTGPGSLFFHDTILQLKTGGVLLQNAFETGVASSQAQVVDYVTPREMSLREIAFANGLSPNRFSDIFVLNTELDSCNSVDKGTRVKVPVS
jgi:hypothetical protein